MRLHGHIKQWNDDRGFGFIAPALGGKEVFLHIKSFTKPKQCLVLKSPMTCEAACCSWQPSCFYEGMSMKQKVSALALILLTGALSNNSFSAPVFSHAAINLPGENKTSGKWLQIIDDQAEWNDFYLSLVPAGTDPASPWWTVPKINFTAYKIVAGGLGLKNTGGSSLVIERIGEESTYTWILL